MPVSPAVGEPLRTLAGIAAYRCQHAGSCCRAGWPIPIEPEPLQVLRSAGWTSEDILGRTADGRCVFHAPSPDGGCRVEATLGVEALPTSCRQFPRLLLADAHGWHLSLSAWCSTVARVLVERAPRGPSATEFLEITHVPADARVHRECLDARDAWPPFLRPGVLAGHAAYEGWEARLLRDGLAPVLNETCALGAALDQMGRWTDRMARWTPPEGELAVLMTRSPWPAPRTDVPIDTAPLDALRAVATELMSRVPVEWQEPDWPAGLTDATDEGPALSQPAAEAAMARHLAVRLVASWVSYQGEGLRSVFASLVSTDALTTVALAATATDRPVTTGLLMSAMRAADWLQLHLLDREPWAAWCRAAETSAGLSRLLSVVRAAHHVRAGLVWVPEAR